MRIFARKIKLARGAPLLHFAPSVDLDYSRPPARVCNRSLVINFFRHGIVMGRWTDSEMDLDQALTAFLRCGLDQQVRWGLDYITDTYGSGPARGIPG